MEALEACFWGSKIKVIFGRVFEASPHATECCGHVFFRPASSAQLGLRFTLLATSTYLEFWRGLEASYVGCQEGNWGPNKPRDAHDAGSWGAAKRAKSVNTSAGRICTV